MLALSSCVVALSWAGGLVGPTGGRSAVLSRHPAPRCQVADASDIFKPPKLTLSELAVGQVVPCTVLEPTDDRGYLVDVGLDQAATLPELEVALLPNQTSSDGTVGQGWAELMRGEVLEVQLTHIESDGAITVSAVQEQRALAWRRVAQLFAEDVTYVSKVMRVTPAGATVAVEGLPAFLPWSHWHLDDDSMANRCSFVGSELMVKFLEADVKRNRLVASRRRFVLQERLDQLAPGQLIDGTVASLRDYGAVVRLADGLDGLLHISQISQVYVRNVSDLLQVGERMRCVVIKVEPKDGSINLSTKMLESKPGEMVKDRAAVFDRAMQVKAVELVDP